MRRRARTILTAVGLGLGVALVIVIAGVSSGLDKAQKKTLNPLAGIGTDLTVTLAPTQQDAGGFQGGPRRRRRKPGSGAVEPLGRHRSLEARQAGHPFRPRLLPARDAADVQAERGRSDRVDRRCRAGDAGPDPAGRASGGRRAEDRRNAEDAGEDDHADTAPAPVRGRLRADAGLLGEEPRSTSAPAAATAAAAAGSAAGAAASAGLRTAASRVPGARVPEVPARLVPAARTASPRRARRSSRC